MRSDRADCTQRGVALPLVLFLVGMAALFAAVIWERGQRAVLDATAVRDRIEARRLVRDALAQQMVLLATKRTSIDGFGSGSDAMRVDGQPEATVGGVLIRRVDARGLVSLDVVDDRRLIMWLIAHGLPADEAPALLDTLRDWTDVDDLRRLNGAEASDYRDAGLPPPANRPLATPYELRQILRWRSLPPKLLDQLMHESTTLPSVGVNVNAAPPAILMTIPGVDAAGAERLIQRRRQAGHVDYASLRELTAYDPQNSNLDVFFQPSDRLRITGCDARRLVCLRHNVVLTPQSPLGPWRILQIEQLSARNAEDPTSEPAPR